MGLGQILLQHQYRLGTSSEPSCSFISNECQSYCFFFKCKIKALSRLGDLRGGYLASWPAPLVRSEVETTLTRTDIRNHLNTTENNCILKRKIYWIAKATTVFLYLYFCIWMSISGLLQYGLVDYNLVGYHLVGYHLVDFHE